MLFRSAAVSGFLNSPRPRKANTLATILISFSYVKNHQTLLIYHNPYFVTLSLGSSSASCLDHYVEFCSVLTYLHHAYHYAVGTKLCDVVCSLACYSLSAIKPGKAVFTTLAVIPLYGSFLSFIPISSRASLGSTPSSI